VLRAIDAGHAEWDEAQTLCYPERGTSYRLTPKGREAIMRAKTQ